MTWTPGGDGGSPITGYRITPYIGSSPPGPDDAVRSGHLGTVTGLSNGTTYTFKVAGVNALATGPESAASNPVMPRATIFEQGVPATLEANDSSAVELGVKFTTDVAGTIGGIRFYKAAGNTGTARGEPMERAGALLAQATASGETASGWQEVSFASPVSIAANTTYVAGYFAPNGHYSATGQGLATAVDNPPLHAVANSTSPNGIYSYSPSTAFPSNTFNATNYWVDVLFTP